MQSAGYPQEHSFRSGTDAGTADSHWSHARRVEFDRYLDDVDDNLRFANRAKDEFLALISHELRTPLTIILGNAEVLDRHHQSMGDEARAEVISDLYAETKRLSSIVEHLLVIARLDSGESVGAEPVMPVRVLGSVANHFTKSVGRDIQVTGETSAVVWGNLDSLRDVFENLVSNATLYSSAASTIEIDVRQVERSCKITVADRGIGLSAQETTEVFEPFYRSPAVAATQVRGMGIGLTACKRIIEAHQGRIWAEQREGGGTVFSIELPVVDITD